MDTRAERSNEWMVDSEEKTMLGLQQKEALFEWLGKVSRFRSPALIVFGERQRADVWFEQVNDTATFKVSFHAELEEETRASRTDQI